MDFARDPVTPLRMLRPQRDTHRMPNSTPAVARLVAGVALLLLTAFFSAGVWLYRTGFDQGNTEAAYRAAHDAIAGYRRLADMADSVKRSLVKP